MTACVINAEAFNAWPCRHHAGRWSQTPNLPGGAPRCVRLRSPTPLNVGLYETPARQAGFVKRADFNVIARGTEACTCALTCAKAAGVRLEQVGKSHRADSHRHRHRASTARSQRRRWWRGRRQRGRGPARRAGGRPRTRRRL